MAAFDALGYEGRLLLALKHPIPENRMVAIRLLGEIGSRSAVAVFVGILDEEDDPPPVAAAAAHQSTVDGDVRAQDSGTPTLRSSC